MNKVFDMGSMAAQNIMAWNLTCKFGTGSDSSFEPAEVTDGAFVILGGLADDEVYNGQKDWNTTLCYAPNSTTYEAKDIVALDLAEIDGGVINGNYYKIGAKTVGLTAPAGAIVRGRRLYKGDKFWLGADNFTDTPTVGGYAGLTAGAVELTPADEAPEAGFAVAIRASKPLAQGTLVDYRNGAYVQTYLVEVL